MANRTITAVLSITAQDRTGKVFERLAQRIERTTKQVESTNARMSASNLRQVQNLSVVSDRMGKTLAFSGATIGAKEAYKNFAEWDRKLTRLAVTANSTDQEIQDAGDAVFRMSKALAVSPDALVDGLATLIASGKSLKESMEFLPSVGKAAQASGADIDDMAKASISLAGTMGIAADKMDSAFDAMSVQGKIGRFELKDMAAELPAAANAFALLGDKGLPGLLRLNAALQTIRESTATSSEAATQAVSLFIRANTIETKKKFAKMDVDLDAEMAAARKRGEPPIEAFVNITRRTLKGDVSKLPRLFQNREALLGMNSLLTKPDAYQKYLAAGRDKNVPGTIDRDVKRVVADAQGALDRMSASFQRMVTAIGKDVEKPVTSLLDRISTDSDKEAAARIGLEKQGYTGLAKEFALINRLPVGPFPASADYEKLARQGGYVPEGRPDLKELQAKMPLAYETLGRYPQRPAGALSAALSLDPLNGAAILKQQQRLRNADFLSAREAERARTQSGRDGDRSRGLVDKMRMTMDYGGNLFRRKEDAAPFASRFAARPEFISNNEPRMTDLKLGRDDGFAALAKSLDAKMGADTTIKTDIESDGKAAGDHLKQGADAIVHAMQEAASIIVRAASQAAAAIASAKPAAAAVQKPVVNANTGKTNTFVNNPAGLGHQ